jgi:hypothetical protein
LGARTNRLAYRGQSGTSETASLLAGAAGSFSRFGLVDGQQWKLFVGGGADYARQHWTGNGRTFDPLMPKAAAGVGTDFTLGSGLAWGLSLRREFPFAKEVGTGDVLAFGATFAMLTATW